VFKKLFLLVITTIVIISLITGFIIWLRIETKPSELLKSKSVKSLNVLESSKTKAEAWLEFLYDNAQIPSISAAVGVNGDLVWAGTIGYADLKNNILADTNSLYRIGSISKSLTASALMKLKEQGVIELDSSFYSYVKDFPTKPSDFTIKQLASHQAGIRHYRQGIGFYYENFRNVEYLNTRQAVAIVENDDLLCTPGTGFNYSTYGYTLLALAMESASKYSFEDIMEMEVFSSIEMRSTFFNKINNFEKDIVTPYLAVKKSLLKAPEVNLSYKYAGGGYISTPSDLVKFGNALLGNKFLSSSSKDILWSPVLFDNGCINPENYGLGFRVSQDDLGRCIHHGGKSVGGYAYFVIYPELEIVVAFCTNVTPMGFVFDRQKEAQKLAAIFSREI
jgi:CubicO group peptidase (beta-lactamase class C family)